MLDSKLDKLIRNSTTSLGRVKDNLLALQALVLYQIIRLLDGDVRQRVNAERHLQLLDSWTLSLQQNYYQVLGMSEDKNSYRYWVLIESIRRTTMISVLLRTLCSVVKVGYCELVPLLSALPVSNTAHLWTAPDTEWRNQHSADNDEVLTYVEWTQKWNAGNVNEIDEYEKLLLVTCHHATGTQSFKVE